MRYKILRPSSPTDPRAFDFGSINDLYNACPVATEYELEQEAVDYARGVHPDLVAMPIKVPIGSGHVVLLGLVAHDNQCDPELAIPYVMFVQAVPENNRDRTTLTRSNHPQYHRELWKPDVRRPPSCVESTRHEVSIRATELEAYRSVPAFAFRREGKLVIYAQVGDAEISLEFVDPFVSLVKFDAEEHW